LSFPKQVKDAIFRPRRETMKQSGLRWSLFFLLLVVRPDATAAEHRILFVGNSYTFANGDLNVAGCYGALADEGVPAWEEIVHETVAKGGWTFHKHGLDAASPGQQLYDLLGEGDTPWDVVVFQEQSQIPAFHPYGAPEWDLSITAAPTLDLYAAAAGARTMFLMTWGRRDGDTMNPAIFPDFPAMQAHLTAGYALYAAEVSTPERQAWVAPVGLAWHAVWDAAIKAAEDPLAPESLFHRLYTGDGSHPSQLGSYLMGLTVYVTMTGRDPTKLNWTPAGTAPDDETTLQAAARCAVLDPPFETVDYGWGALHRYPWLHDWEDVAQPDEDGVVTISHPVLRQTALVKEAVSVQRVVVGGEDGGAGRVVVVSGGTLTTEEVLLGDGGVGSLEICGGLLETGTVGVSVSLTGGTWVVPSDVSGATMEGDLLLDDDGALRFDLTALPGVDRLGAHLTVDGAVTLDARILVVPADSLDLDGPTTWDLLDATSIESLPNLALDGPDGATMEVVDGGAGQILRVTLPGGEPPAEPTPDVVTGEDVPNRGQDTAADEAAAPDVDTVIEPGATVSSSGSGGCGVGWTGAYPWWMVLLVWSISFGVATVRRPSRAGRSGTPRRRQGET